MIRRPLSMIGLKQSDIDNMEQCLQRRFKNTQVTDPETPSNIRVTPETPFRIPARRPDAFAVRDRPPPPPDASSTPNASTAQLSPRPDVSPQH